MCVVWCVGLLPFARTHTHISVCVQSKAEKAEKIDPPPFLDAVADTYVVSP